MFRWILSATTIVICLSASWVYSTTVPRTAPLQGIRLPAYASQNFEIVFQGEQRAAAVCIGGGNSLLGIYVFDQHGNCLAREDQVSLRPFRNPELTYYPDDVGVVWYPLETAAQTVEIVNFGSLPNRCELAPK
jgi:hypothetical protein